MSREDINEVSYALGTLKASVESLNESVRASILKQDAINDGMDRRVRKVESKQHYISGFWGALGAVAGLFLGSRH